MMPFSFPIRANTRSLLLGATLLVTACSSRPVDTDGAVDATTMSDGTSIDGAMDGAGGDTFLENTITLPGTPPGTEGLFGGTPSSDAMHTPSFVYPANETVFPQNVYRVLFQWRSGGNDRFRVTFESEHLHLTLFTAGVHDTCTAAGTGLSCFEPTPEIWQMIAGTNPHGSVRVTIDGALSTAPGMFYRSQVLNLGFSRGPVPGAIYYWSTTQAGVRRGTIAGAAPANFLTPNPREQTDGQCVACHTLSRHGNRLAADVGGEKLWVVEVSPTYPPPRIVTVDPMGARIDSTWATFSFDESRVISSARGILTLRRADNGGVVNTLPLGMGGLGTQPDWSPDGTLVAFTRGQGRTVQGGRIATIDSMSGDAWGNVRMLVGSGAMNDTNNYPSFSWDSQWLAYVHSTGSGKNDVTSDLWLMARDGTMQRALTRANTIINDGVISTPTVQDNMPTWAPSQAGTDDYAWVAFSSTRDYGGVLSMASHLGRHEQIWVAAVDLSHAAGTNDPSYPAFRLPAQDLDEDTHRPFWAEDRVMIPDEPDAGMPTCVPEHGDCSSGVCCPGFTCTPDASEHYTCEIVTPG